MTTKDQNINIRSQEIQEILAKFPSWLIRFGSLLLLLVVVTAIVASAFVSFPLKEEISVSIQPLREELELFPNQDGQLEQLLVVQSELVKIGQTIAILQSDALSADIFLLESKLDSLVNSPHLKESIDFSKKLSLGAAQVEYDQFTKALQSSNVLAAIDNKLQTKLEELNKNLVSLQGKSKSCTEILNELNQKYSVDLDSYKKGEIAKVEVDKSMAIFNRKKAECEALIIEINSSKSTIQELKNKISIQSPVQTKSAPPIEKYFDAELQELLLALANWKKEFLVLASAEGHIQLKENLTVQDSVKTNMALCKISQLSNKYILTAKLSPTTFQNLKLDQEIQLILDSFSKEEYSAVITQVSEIPQDFSEDSCKVILILPNGLEDLNGKSFPVANSYTGKLYITSNNKTLLLKAIHGLGSLLQLN